MHSPLRPGSYRYTTCKLDDVDSEMLHCEGRIMIQDYKPRHYGFSFGYSCKYLNRSSLSGLSFNFTISEQTNKTTCTNTPRVNDKIFECDKLYPYTSLPNMICTRNTSEYKKNCCYIFPAGCTNAYFKWTTLLHVCKRVFVSHSCSRM